MQTIGDRLKQWREAAKLNQDQAATQLGIPKSSYQKYEIDLRLPGADSLEHFIRAGISANWLIAAEGPMLLADLAPTYSQSESRSVTASENGQPEAGVFLAKINVDALAAIIEGVLKISPNAAPNEVAKHAVSLYQQCMDGGLITPDGVGNGPSGKAA